MSLIGTLVYWRLHPPKPIPDMPSVGSSTREIVKSGVPSKPLEIAADLNSSSVASEPQTASAKPAPDGTPARTEPTPETRQLVTTLSQLDVTHGPVTAEQAAAWKETLKQLAAQGPAAIPAIGEFLEKHLNINFEAAESDRSLGFTSLRLALLDTLQRIGGPEALELTLHTLQSTVDPTEIAVIANYLEKSDAQQYREAVVSAARAALKIAASGQWDGRDVAPLFDLLKNYDGVNAIPDFEKYANNWFNYAPLMLAQLPDGAGVQSLIRLAQEADRPTSLGRDICQRMLAQVSLQHPEAADALLEQIKGDRIRTAAWPGLASALTGSTLELTRNALDPTRSLTGGPGQGGYHIVLGNQNYTEHRPPANMTDEEIRCRIQLIDTLLPTTSNLVGIENLHNARKTLNSRITP